MSVNGKFGIYVPAFGDPTPSGDLNLRIGHLSFSVSRQEAIYSIFLTVPFEKISTGDVLMQEMSTFRP